jgi:hypothetical protein
MMEGDEGDEGDEDKGRGWRGADVRCASERVSNGWQMNKYIDVPFE